MTKAERIYQNTRRECKDHIETWGKPEAGFNHLSYGENETICTRTLNAVEKYIISAEKRLKLNRELGVGTEERNNLEEQVLWMIRATLQNDRMRIA